MTGNSVLGAPIPLSEIESVLAWVDSFKLSRATKKINRDFSDAVLLAEILATQYPKLVEMHNYPPRNSHALKLNNWMTLNRKVLKKLKLNLCCNTMEQLANSAPGVIERVLVMVRDKIRRDEELEKSTKEADTNMSSGGSYYEACGDEDHVLVVPVKARVNGVLEVIQQKVVSYDAYMVMKGELADATDAVELLKQKVDHLDNLIKLKDERISELQKQLDRKQLRRKESETIQNSLAVPFDVVPSPTVPAVNLSNKPSRNTLVLLTTKTEDTNAITTVAPKLSSTVIKSQENQEVKPDEKLITNIISTPTPNIINTLTPKSSLKDIKVDEKIEPIPVELKEKGSKTSTDSITRIPSISEVTSKEKNILDLVNDVERIKSDVFKEANIYEDKNLEGDEEFKDSEPGNIVTIEDTIQKELTVFLSKSQELNPFNHDNVLK